VTGWAIIVLLYLPHRNVSGVGRSAAVGSSCVDRRILFVGARRRRARLGLVGAALKLPITPSSVHGSD